MWRDLAEERLAASGAVAYMTLGNDDSEDLAEIFAAGERLRYAEDKICLIDDAVELASFGYSTPTPWHTPREMAEEELEARLRELVAGLSRPEQAIFNVHCPPRDTAIDQAPQLDDQLRPRAGPGGGLVMEAVGSTAVRRIIENVGPQLALHGHVHESPGMARVGRTLCINPGSDYASGVLRGAIIDLDEAGSVRSWQLVQG
jgi:Icc-related predicted phosphoesterase